MEIDLYKGREIKLKLVVSQLLFLTFVHYLLTILILLPFKCSQSPEFLNILVHFCIFVKKYLIKQYFIIFIFIQQFLLYFSFRQIILNNILK